MLRALLTSSALYLLLIGFGLMVVPLHFGIGAIPADASPQLLALVRLLGGPFLGIAALNLMARSAEPSPARNAILLANCIGFLAVAVNDVHGVLTGEARPIARYFLILHLAFAAAFIAATMRNWHRA
jgi:hypothetical protein